MDYSEPRASAEEARARALALIESSNRPVLIGEVALACGPLWGLEDAEQLLVRLHREKLIEQVEGTLVRYQRVRLGDER